MNFLKMVNNIVLIALTLALGSVLWQWNLAADEHAFGQASGLKLIMFLMLTFAIIFSMAVVAHFRPNGDKLKNLIDKIYEAC